MLATTGQLEALRGRAEQDEAARDDLTEAIRGLRDDLAADPAVDAGERLAAILDQAAEHPGARQADHSLAEEQLRELRRIPSQQEQEEMARRGFEAILALERERADTSTAGQREAE